MQNLTDMDILKRMDDISTELSQIKKIGSMDIDLIEAKPRGAVKVILKNTKTNTSLSWVVGYNDSLDHVSDCLGYSNTLSAKGASLISPIGVVSAFLGLNNRFILTHDDSVEDFRVRREDRAEVSAILTEILGDLYVEEKPREEKK